MTSPSVVATTVLHEIWCDAFNALMTEQKKHLSLPEVLRQMEVTHRRLIDYVEGVPEDQFREETRFRSSPAAGDVQPLSYIRTCNPEMGCKTGFQSYKTLLIPPPSRMKTSPLNKRISHRCCSK
jgi:hypothetical protein